MTLVSRQIQAWAMEHESTPLVCWVLAKLGLFASTVVLCWTAWPVTQQLDHMTQNIVQGTVEAL